MVVKRWLEEYYQVCGGCFVDHIDHSASESLAESMFLKMSDVILRQFKFVPEFDCTNTQRALAKSAVRFPVLDRTMVFRLLDYARAHKWGRRARAAS